MHFHLLVKAFIPCRRRWEENVFADTIELVQEFVCEEELQGAVQQQGRA